MNKIKTIIFPLMLLMFFVACKSNKKTETRDIQLLSDSTAYNNNTLSDSSRTSNADAVPGATVHHKTVSPSGSNATTTHSGSKSSTISSGNTSSSSTSSSEGTHKKGWSKAAQGAVIGGAAGAVGGAIISKHKGTGAAIGAAVGAAGGYIIGRNKDKKDGRVKK